MSNEASTGMTPDLEVRPCLRGLVIETHSTMSSPKQGSAGSGQSGSTSPNPGKSRPSSISSVTPDRLMRILLKSKPHPDYPFYQVKLGLANHESMMYRGDLREMNVWPVDCRRCASTSRERMGVKECSTGEPATEEWMPRPPAMCVGKGRNLWG